MDDPTVASGELAEESFRVAVDQLRAAIDEDPLRDDVRIALVELYRERGHPDQAGRWGAVIPGAATDRELRSFVRSFRPDDSRERIASVLRTTPERVPDELVELVRTSSTAHPPSTTEVTWGSVAVGVAALALYALLAGSAIVFVSALLGLGDTPTSARTVAVTCGFLGALSCTLWSVRSVAQRRWLSAVVSLVVAGVLLAVGCGLLAGWASTSSLR